MFTRWARQSEGRPGQSVVFYRPSERMRLDRSTINSYRLKLGTPSIGGHDYHVDELIQRE